MDRLSLISLLVGGVLPLLVATVTKASWPEPLKALLLAVLSAATGAGTALTQSGPVSWSSIASNAALTFISGAAVAAGTWKPTGAIAKLESIFVKDVEPLLAPLAAKMNPVMASATALPGVSFVPNPHYTVPPSLMTTTSATVYPPPTTVFASPPMPSVGDAPDGTKG